jgi:enolase
MLEKCLFKCKDLLLYLDVNEFMLPIKYNVPNLAFTIFKCGKSVGSKVKFERFMLIINNSIKMKEDDLNNLIAKIYASVKKVLSAGKKGVDGMTLNSEGSYNSPNDTINDTMKLMEEIIKDTGEQSKLSIGIDCHANNYYNSETMKYEMDGFKQPSEVELLIEFYLKYCTDHPLITYLEDPIADSDYVGWKKMYWRFENMRPGVTITCKNLIDENPKLLKEVRLYL